MPRYRVGIDIGGTFTDFVVLDLEDRTLQLGKTLTTPHDLWEGIAAGLAQVDVALEDAEIAHGTTVGLNTLLERRGAPTGLITTMGFRDAYEIGRGARPEMYNLFYRKPEPLVPREHRLEVRERLDAAGNVLVPLEEEDVVAAADHFRANGIAEVAICFLHSYRNPAHELRAEEIVRETYPEATVSASHALMREWREYERTSTTCINAYVRPRSSAYIDRALSSLEEQGYGRRFFVNQSSGGVISAETAKAKPVVTLLSGPAGGVSATARLGSMTARSEVIAFDMGGTSTDVAVISGSQPRLTADSKVDGHPIAVPAIDVHSIGAGGGSLAWLDDVGALNVGPKSAGADPGPACYGRGGTQATVTDANLLLGRVAPPAFIPGGLELDADAAAAIDEHVGRGLGLGTVEAAAGIVEIVNLKMAMAVRAVTVQRGLDPKDFTLFAFGGAGAGHACWIARELGIPRIVVPVAPGQFSALGISLTDVRHDLVKTIGARAPEVTASSLNAAFDELEREARKGLEAEGVDRDRHMLAPSVDARYQGQEYTVNVPLNGEPLTEGGLDRLRASFHDLHQQMYSHSSPEEPVEVVNVRLAAVGRLPEVVLPDAESGESSPPEKAEAGTAKVHVDASAGFVDAVIWDRVALLAGNVIEGPGIVADVGATTVLPPGTRCVVDAFGNLLVEVDAA